MRKRSDWTSADKEAVIRALAPLNCYVREGSAECAFLRPTDEQLARLMAGDVPAAGEDWFHGRNIWSLHWWAQGVRDQLKLARRLASEVGPGGTFAWHSGADYREFRADAHRRTPCQPPQP